MYLQELDYSMIISSVRAFSLLAYLILFFLGRAKRSRAAGRLGGSETGQWRDLSA